VTDTLSLLFSIQFRDILDICIVAAVVYLVLWVVRQGRSATAMRGLLGLMLAGIFAYVLARGFYLVTTTLIFDKFGVVIVLVFVIVFQNELRKALTDFGQLWVLRRLFPRDTGYLDEMLGAVEQLAKGKTGALICIEGRNPLRAVADTGTQIDAVMTGELVRTIFTTYSPLHDGAVVVRNGRIAAAGCLLPLSDNPHLSKELGTRHRAAIGVSEETDATVVVVSEETGIISLCHRGRIERNHTAQTLREAIEGIIHVQGDEKNADND
jgi:diadenylate cyclase